MHTPTRYSRPVIRESGVSDTADIPTVIVKGVDAGDCFLTWRWSDDLSHPAFHVISRHIVAELVDRLHRAFPGASGGERPSDKFDDLMLRPERERQFFARAASDLLPARLVGELRDRGRGTAHDRFPVIRIHPPPSLARLPWELLVLDGGQERLLDLADVRLEVPVTVAADRDRRFADRPGGRRTWCTNREDPVFYVLDPSTGDRPVLASPPAPVLANRIEFMLRAGRLPDRVTSLADVLHMPIGRSRLSVALTNPRPSRLVYVGHVSSADAAGDRPESAAMHLTDGPDVDGYAALLTHPDGSRHRPLTAYDLLAGPNAAQTHENASRPAGFERWPMPPRVALLGCDSGSDHRFTETFGLVVAMIINGAELVTATRWALPTDRFFHQVAGAPRDVTPTSAMIVAVDEAHEAPDAAAALHGWQRGRLRSWRTEGNVADSPLTWASLATHQTPRPGTISSVGPR